jgi:sRNA-binding carbon storage regulator CsrA
MGISAARNARMSEINAKGWLSLTRRPGESLLIGSHHELFVVSISPPDVRFELFTLNADGSMNMESAKLAHGTLNQAVTLLDQVQLFVKALRPREVRLAIRAPEHLLITRAELGPHEDAKLVGSS